VTAPAREPDRLPPDHPLAPGWWCWYTGGADDGPGGAADDGPETRRANLPPEQVCGLAADPRGRVVGWYPYSRDRGVVADVAFPTRDAALDGLTRVVPVTRATAPYPPDFSFRRRPGPTPERDPPAAGG